MVLSNLGLNGDCRFPIAKQGFEVFRAAFVGSLGVKVLTSGVGVLSFAFF